MSTEQPVTNVGETDTNEPSIDPKPETAEAPGQSVPGQAVSSENAGGASAAAVTQREEASAQREDEDEPRPAGEDFGSLLDQFEQEQSSLQEGEVVRGTV